MTTESLPPSIPVAGIGEPGKGIGVLRGSNLFSAEPVIATWPLPTAFVRRVGFSDLKTFLGAERVGRVFEAAIHRRFYRKPIARSTLKQNL